MLWIMVKIGFGAQILKVAFVTPKSKPCQCPHLSVNIQICDIPSNNVQEWVVKVLPIAQNLVRKEIVLIMKPFLMVMQFTAAASYASLATASTSHFWSIVPTYETSNVCRIPSGKKTI